MKLLLFLLSAAAMAQNGPQTTVTLTGPASSKPGMTVVLSLSLSGVTVPGPAGLQWAVQFPPDPWKATVTPGVAAVAGSKDILVCDSSNSQCVLVGMNVNTLGNGSVAQYTLNVPATAAGGKVTIGLSGVMAAGPDGVVIPTALGPAYVLVVLDKADLNADGVVDIQDVRMMAQEVTGASTVCKDDQNGDGRCDIRDVFAVLLKALGR
jgi:hypothetical protein